MVNKVKSNKKKSWSSKQCGNSKRSILFFFFFPIFTLIANCITFFVQILGFITKFHNTFPHKLSSSGFLHQFPLNFWVYVFLKREPLLCMFCAEVTHLWEDRLYHSILSDLPIFGRRVYVHQGGVGIWTVRFYSRKIQFLWTNERAVTFYRK